MIHFILTLSLTFLGANAKQNCDSIETLSQESNEIQTRLIANQGMTGCTDSTGVTYDVGSEMFVSDCEYMECQEDDVWSDIMILDDCFIIECVAGACVDISQFGQEGSYSSVEDCQLECGTTNELIYECVFDGCVDVSIFGEVGSFSSLEECQESCGEQLPYECLLGNCVDISQFGQEGSYSSEEQCLKECEAVGGEPSFECIAGACIDIGQFGQEGTYDSLGECEKACQSNNKSSSYECIAEMCVDIGQFGQVGSYDNLEDCQIICEGAPATIQEFSTEILIAPNPFNNYTQIYSKNLILNYNLFDIKGRKIKSQTINKNSFKLERELLTTGIYYLEIVSNNKQTFNKLIIK